MALFFNTGKVYIFNTNSMHYILEKHFIYINTLRYFYDFYFQIWSTEWAAGIGSRYAGHLLYASVWWMLSQEMPTAESQLSGDVSAKRDLLLDDSRANCSDL